MVLTFVGRGAVRKQTKVSLLHSNPRPWAAQNKSLEFVLRKYVQNHYVFRGLQEEFLLQQCVFVCESCVCA